MTSRASALGAGVTRDGVTWQVLVQGEQFHLPLRIFGADGDPVDISDWTISCEAEYYTADFSDAGSSATIGNYEAYPVDRAALPVELVKPSAEAEPGEGGEATMLVPEDIWPDDIEIDLAASVPAVVLYFRIASPDGTVRKPRHVLLVRRG